nr:FMN-binding protein [uncultured Butyrivibrio sp.]
MKLLISLVLVFVICQAFGKSIKKHAPIWYISLFAIALLSMFIPAAPIWLQQVVTGFITRGTLATAMFIWVMYARILPKGRKTMANFMSLRAPLAIGATFLILLHSTFYLTQYIGRIMNGYGITSYEIFAGIFSLVMVFLLAPLTITSFMAIRKKMNPVTWKKLQRFSYLFYGMIYLHVFLLFSRQITKGHTSYGRELAIYTAVFGLYLVRRVALYLEMSNKKAIGVAVTRVGNSLLVTMCVCIFFWPYALNYSNETEAMISRAVVSEKSIPIKNEGVPEVMGASRSDSEEEDDIEYADGEYTGSGMGYNGPITVTVTISNRRIEKVKVISGEDDDPYYTWAIKEIPGAIEKSNTTEVDTVSGATTSSKAIIAAVNDALQKAEK